MGTHKRQLLTMRVGDTCRRETGVNVTIESKENSIVSQSGREKIPSSG